MAIEKETKQGLIESAMAHRKLVEAAVADLQAQIDDAPEGEEDDEDSINISTLEDQISQLSDFEEELSNL